MGRIYRERKRAILKALIREYGVSEAYDMYGDFMGSYRQKCTVCGTEIRDYSEWSDTGYEIKECTNGCWSHTTYGLSEILQTKDFYFKGKLTEHVIADFENQIKKNAEISRYNRKVFWKKKKSQRKK